MPSSPAGLTRLRLLALVAAMGVVASGALVGWRAASGPGGSGSSSAGGPGRGLAARRPTSPLPPGLPSHLGIGVSAPPSADGIYGWLPGSGVPFDYAYQYLAGGVNTGNGWTTWNDRAQFPLLYARGALAHHYTPVLDYYMLLQSNGPCGSCGEAQKDLSHLDDPATMASYYADFAKLMQRLGTGTWDGVKGYGRTVIVHIEPDLSGYAEQAVVHRQRCYGHCTGTGNAPFNLHAAVADTGVADVAAYPNTYQGFNFALLHLRDSYATNVLLAFHISGWSTGKDIGSSSDRGLDATAMGAQAATFARLAGVAPANPGTSTYDLLFNDVADRDAGVSHVWWDPTNRSLPDFARWETYLAAVTQTTGKRAIVWQVPLGNQWFRTEDGSDGHTQDNRIEYFFAHSAELADAGVVGVLYGRGNRGSTTNTDDKHDGVTNPAPVCTTHGPAGAVCNVHLATSPDDDGGYLRMQAARYYLHPLALPR